MTDVLPCGCHDRNPGEANYLKMLAPVWTLMRGWESPPVQRPPLLFFPAIDRAQSGSDRRAEWTDIPHLEIYQNQNQQFSCLQQARIHDVALPKRKRRQRP